MDNLIAVLDSYMYKSLSSWSQTLIFKLYLRIWIELYSFTSIFLSWLRFIYFNSKKKHNIRFKIKQTLNTNKWMEFITIINYMRYEYNYPSLWHFLSHHSKGHVLKGPFLAFHVPVFISVLLHKIIKLTCCAI